MVVILAAALVAACSSTEVEPKDGPCRELEEIDSLMWKQPDSAFARLREFAASSKADSLDVFNGHYCQLLISELLYKNYYEQSNREELLKAVNYFDSLMMDNRQGAGKLRAEEQERNVFLDARAHYINGVGFYERGNEVLACEEYLKALGLMEDFFDENDLVGNRAVFMFYTYNRLLELFSAQFMMDPALTCGEQVLYYCQKDTSLSNEIPNTFLYIGTQYDKIGKKVEARQYYLRAIETIQDTNNLVFRDAVSLKALCDYQLGMGVDQPVKTLKQVLYFSESEAERLTRFLTIGDIFFEEGMFDSALVYLEPVFIGYENNLYRVKSAEYLRVIYDYLENKEKSDTYVRFIADHRRSEGENKTLISKLEAVFNDYQGQKQERQAEIERENAMKKAMGITISIVVAALVVYLVLILRNKKQLKMQEEETDRRLGKSEQEHENELRRLQAETEQQLADGERKHQLKVEEITKRHEEELKLQKDQSEQEIARTRKRHEEELEAERNAYQKEREELERSLQQSKENVSALQEELGRKRTDAAEHYAAFLKEPVCVKINSLVRDLNITTRKPYSHYHISLDNETITQLSEAVTAHYGELKPALQCHYPGIGHEDLLLCYLYLLGLSNKQIAVLRQRDYSTVRKQAKELMGKLRIDETVREYVLRVGGIEGAAVE